MQTPDGPVAIEDLREGDMVIARDEDGGVTGIYPVTAIMQRQAASVLHLTLEDAAGDTSQLGITVEHPLFDAAAGWTQAGELVAGDVVLDRYMQPLTVLAVAVDDTPQLVHNLEIGGASTYFAGDMAAWAHNALWNLKTFGRKFPPAPGCNGAARGPDGRFKGNPMVEEGNVGDFLTGLATGIADDRSGLCPDNPAGRAGNTLGNIINKFLNL